MANGQVVINGQQVGAPGGQTVAIGPYTIACSAFSTIQELVLVNGPNSISTPSAAGVTPVMAIIVPGAGETVHVILKGLSGDSGFFISNATPTLLSFGDNTYQASGFVLASSGAGSATWTIIWC